MSLRDWIARLARRAPPATPARPRVYVHWSHDGHGLPICGASDAQPWTSDFWASTCRECRRQGGPIQLQHEINFR